MEVVIIQGSYLFLLNFRDHVYEPCINLMENKNDVTIFMKEEWEDLFKNSRNSTNYLSANSSTESLYTEVFSSYQIILFI